VRLTNHQIELLEALLRERLAGDPDVSAAAMGLIDEVRAARGDCNDLQIERNAARARVGAVNPREHQHCMEVVDAFAEEVRSYTAGSTAVPRVNPWILVQLLERERAAAVADAERANQELVAETPARWERVRKAIEVRLKVDLEHEWPALRDLLKHELSRAEKAERARDEAIARANHVPGLTAALDEARWERDQVKRGPGRDALDELARQVRDADALRAKLAALGPDGGCGCGACEQLRKAG
jgi:hypothetical protein